jgi:HAD superfamily hydrolase (TIGR01509 family)
MDNVGEKQVVEKFGKRLQEARQKAGLTQQDLCDKADLSYSTLAKIERGAIKSPSIFTVEKIADVIGVSVDSLIGRQSGGVLAEKKISKSGIRFVYFDINGCLVRFFHRAFTRLAEESGVSLEKIESVFWRYNDQINRGEMSMDEFNKHLASQLGKDKVAWQDYYLDAVDPIKEMQELVEWAHENYKIGLCSNSMPGVIDSLLEKGIIPNIEYDIIIDSSEVHSIKPEKKIYELAQEKAGVKPDEILLIDDTRANLMAAERMDWKVLWFDDYRPSDSVGRVKQVLEF